MIGECYVGDLFDAPDPSLERDARLRRWWLAIAKELGKDPIDEGERRFMEAFIAMSRPRPAPA